MLMESIVEGLNLRRSDTFMKRLLGLIPFSNLHCDGMIIEPCNSVHTFFMHEAIDVYFLSETGRVLKVVKNMKKNRISYCFNAVMVVEIFTGNSDFECQVGDYLYV